MLCRARNTGMHKRRMGFLALAALATLPVGCGVPSALDASAYLETVSVNDANLAALPDGIYEGEYALAIPPGNIAVYRRVSARVAVSAGAYEGIAIVSPAALADDPRFLGMIDRIVAANSLHVDGVSGATFSSRSLLKAVEAACTPRR